MTILQSEFLVPAGVQCGRLYFCCSDELGWHCSGTATSNIFHSRAHNYNTIKGRTLEKGNIWYFGGGCSQWHVLDEPEFVFKSHWNRTMTPYRTWSHSPPCHYKNFQCLCNESVPVHCQFYITIIFIERPKITKTYAPCFWPVSNVDLTVTELQTDTLFSSPSKKYSHISLCHMSDQIK